MRLILLQILALIFQNLLPCACRSYNFSLKLLTLTELIDEPTMPEPFRDATAWLRMQSDANPTKFPDNREINREFYKIRASAAIFVTDRPENSKAYSKIPY